MFVQPGRETRFLDMILLHLDEVVREDDESTITVSVDERHDMSRGSDAGTSSAYR